MKETVKDSKKKEGMHRRDKEKRKERTELEKKKVKKMKF